MVEKCGNTCYHVIIYISFTEKKEKKQSFHSDAINHCTDGLHRIVLQELVLMDLLEKVQQHESCFSMNLKVLARYHSMQK